MKNIKCFLGSHDPERVSGPVPVKFSGEFSVCAYDWHYALGKCRRCGKFEMVRCRGASSYYPVDMKTLEEWLEILKADYHSAKNSLKGGKCAN